MARFIKLDKGFHRDMGNPGFRPVLINVDTIERVYLHDGYVWIALIESCQFFVKQSFEEVQALLNGNPEQSTKE